MSATDARTSITVYSVTTFGGAGANEGNQAANVSVGGIGPRGESGACEGGDR